MKGRVTPLSLCRRPPTIIPRSLSLSLSLSLKSLSLSLSLALVLFRNIKREVSGGRQKGVTPRNSCRRKLRPAWVTPNGGQTEGGLSNDSHSLQRRERKRSRKRESGLALLTVFSLFVHPYESENRKEQRRRARTEGWRLRAIA